MDVKADELCHSLDFVQAELDRALSRRRSGRRVFKVPQQGTWVSLSSAAGVPRSLLTDIDPYAVVFKQGVDDMQKVQHVAGLQVTHISLYRCMAAGMD